MRIAAAKHDAHHVETLDGDGFCLDCFVSFSIADPQTMVEIIAISLGHAIPQNEFDDIRLHLGTVIEVIRCSGCSTPLPAGSCAHRRFCDACRRHRHALTCAGKQCANKRAYVKVPVATIDAIAEEYVGTLLPLKQVALRYGVPYHTAYQALKSRGVPFHAIHSATVQAKWRTRSVPKRSPRGRGVHLSAVPVLS